MFPTRSALTGQPVVVQGIIMDVSQSLNAQLDGFQLQLLNHSRAARKTEDERDVKLQALVRSFDKPPKLEKLATILSKYDFSGYDTEDQSTDSEWLVLARASIVVTDTLIREFFERSLPLSRDVLYWEQLLCSRWWRGFYTIQTAPIRISHFFRLLWHRSRSQIDGQTFSLGSIRKSLFNGTLFTQVAFPHLQGDETERISKFLSFDTIIRQEINDKKASLLGLRDIQAQAVGMLVAEARFNQMDTLRADVSDLAEILSLVSDQSASSINRHATTFQTISIERPTPASSPSNIANKLLEICESFSTSRNAFDENVKAASCPSRLVRYWPVTLGVYLSGSSILRYITNRRQELFAWANEMFETVRGFWINWIIEPSNKILATIRHDEGSEVALLSSKSLAADMQSLERMVVEFAQDNPQFAQTTDLNLLRASARDGDVTPVLMAYESDLKSPLRSALTGTLVRSLLIQIQKTKVDVEVAINGIDKLLKSQELVFGFLGVSPAIVLLWATFRSFSTARGRQGQLGSGQVKVTTIKTLRNIDRLLCKSTDTSMSYRKRGLVLCEVQILRLCAKSIPSQIRDQYLEDLSDLERGATIKIQRSNIKRVIRTYSTFLSL